MRQSNSLPTSGASNLGRNIAAARKRKGITQEALASALGHAQAVISQWETGGRTPRLDNLHRIAAALDVEPSELLREASAESSPPESAAA